MTNLCVQSYSIFFNCSTFLYATILLVIIKLIIGIDKKDGHSFYLSLQRPHRSFTLHSHATATSAPRCKPDCSSLGLKCPNIEVPTSNITDLATSMTTQHDHQSERRTNRHYPVAFVCRTAQKIAEHYLSRHRGGRNTDNIIGRWQVIFYDGIWRWLVNKCELQR